MQTYCSLLHAAGSYMLLQMKAVEEAAALQETLTALQEQQTTAAAAVSGMEVRLCLETIIACGITRFRIKCGPAQRTFEMFASTHQVTHQPQCPLMYYPPSGLFLHTHLPAIALQTSSSAVSLVAHLFTLHGTHSANFSVCRSK